ncbi:MAG: UDP-N-acetylmuramoyl-tripeptide--D-alanyl-D-alanine ligase [Methylococcaceae bacterium]|nr:UDP-N-acetylmuramoyl-tripeptide--D-alanyl-D-alanine ligase [Methylococcaceae bacterium]
MKMKLSEIAACVNGKLIGKDVLANGVSIDTRTLQTGQIYVAIVGQLFDGHDFVELTEKAGAIAVLTHKKLETNLPQIIVSDTHLALAELAGAWREKMDLNIIGVTGSNGKTTIKEMLAAILSVNNSVLFTQGNLNNDIGVPLTLLKISPEHRYAVIEMGANHAGEIAYTSRFVNADVVIITNVGAAHLEGFGDVNGVARAKGEIIETLNLNGVAILNADDAFFDYWKNVADSRKIITFGLSKNANVRAENIDIKIENHQFVTRFDLKIGGSEIKINLPLAGNHNVLNALAATAATLALDIPLVQIKQGLETMSPVKGRLQLLRGRLGSTLINDTYNANTSSLKAALNVLEKCDGEHWVILGAFGELGDDTERLHFEMGETLKNHGIKRLFAVGELTKQTIAAFGENAQHFSSQTELLETITNLLKGNETILIKGSRLQRMENITTALVKPTGL